MMPPTITVIVKKTSMMPMRQSIMTKARNMTRNMTRKKRRKWWWLSSIQMSLSKLLIKPSGRNIGKNDNAPHDLGYPRQEHLHDMPEIFTSRCILHLKTSWAAFVRNQHRNRDIFHNFRPFIEFSCRIPINSATAMHDRLYVLWLFGLSILALSTAHSVQVDINGPKVDPPLQAGENARNFTDTQDRRAVAKVESDNGVMETLNFSESEDPNLDAVIFAETGTTTNNDLKLSMHETETNILNSLSNMWSNTWHRFLTFWKM